MTQGDEEKAWRDIVERWDDEPAAGDAPDIESQLVQPLRPVEPPREEPADEAWNPRPFDLSDEGTFVPPTPPPMEWPSPPRLIAWSGVIGAPVLFVLFLLVGATMPAWASTLLVCAFVGGFVFLVATMRNEPRDPGDDGAVV